MKTKLFRLNFSMRTASRAACYSALLAAITMILAFAGTGLLRPVSLATGTVSDKTHKSRQSAHNDSHKLVATYYSVKENLKATLMLSNQGTGTMPIQISLFSHDGYQSDLPPTTLQAHEVRAIDLGQHIRRGSNFEEGSLQIVYQGMPLELGGVVTLVNSARSLIFDEELTEPVKAFASARLEGVWWRPTGSTEVRLALTNTSNAQISVSVATGKKDNGNSDATTLTLVAHETRVLSTEEHNGGNELELHGKAGGISIKHTGAPGSLTAYGFVQEPEKGFSNVIDFTDPQKVKTARLDGAGIRFGTIANQPLSQVAVVRNAGTTPTTVQGQVSYTLTNGRQGIKKLDSFQLAPNEVRELALPPVSLPTEVVTAAGLEFSYDGKPGSVIASALSLSQNRDQVFRVPMRDAAMQSSSTGHYPWSIDQSSSTIVYIKNTTGSLKQFTMYVSFDGGNYALGLKPIPAWQTLAFDVRGIRDGQQPDGNGLVIPFNATHGQVHWSVQGSESKTLIGRVEQFDLAQGMSMTGACGVCCPDSFSNSFLTPNSVTGFPGDTSQFTSNRQDMDCGGNPLPPYTVTYGNWTSDNTSIATINSSGLATAQNAGTTALHNFYYANVWHYVGTPDDEHCDTDLVDSDCSASCEVQPPCAYPINYRQTGVTDLGGGILRFNYAWDSSTGNLSNLSSCTVGEIVTYPGGNDPYNWASPPYASGSSSPNPTVIDLAAQSGQFNDTHSPKPFQSPYTLSEFDATQYYRYRCPCSSGGNYVNLMGPITIKRKVQLVPFINWRYTITKSGSSAVLTPLP